MTNVEIFETLVGSTCTSFKATDNSLTLYTSSDIHTFDHVQECCEDVYIESIVGDLTDLLNLPILEAKATVENNRTDEGLERWTLIELSTIRGSVTIYFFSSYNDYNCPDVDYTCLPNHQVAFELWKLNETLNQIKVCDIKLWTLEEQNLSNILHTYSYNGRWSKTLNDWETVKTFVHPDGSFRHLYEIMEKTLKSSLAIQLRKAEIYDF